MTLRKKLLKAGCGSAGLKSCRPWQQTAYTGPKQSTRQVCPSLRCLSLHDAALMACRLVLRRAARTGSRTALTRGSTIKASADPATCLGPRPDLVDAPLTFDPLQYAFDQGRATGQPVCGVVDEFLTEAECSKLIDLATARGYESTEETIQLGGRKGRTNNKNIINISGRCVISSETFADKLWARLAVSSSMQPVKALLKQSNPGWTPVGLNSVFRFLRYGPGDYFRPHRDSHFVPEVMDERHGRVTSFQSLLLYLDAPDSGGADRCLLCSRGPMDTASPS